MRNRLRSATLQGRSLSFYWRPHVAVMLGVAAGTAALTGALVVGDSMRGSLREAALGRLGRVDHVLTSRHFFRESLAQELFASVSGSGSSAEANSVILVSGSATHVDTRARANRITVLGVDDRFWKLRGDRNRSAAPELEGRSVVFNDRQAEELRAGSCR